MKRVVSSSIITLFIIVAVTITFFYLRNFRKSDGDPVKAIPADASFFIVFDPAVKNLNEINKFQYWSSISKLPAFSKLKINLAALDSILKSNQGFKEFFLSSPTFMSAHISGADDFDMLFLKSMKGSIDEAVVAEMLHDIAGSQNQVTERNYDGNIIREILLNDKKSFTFCVSKGVLIASFTPFLVEDALRQLKLGKPIISDFNNTKANFSSTGFDLYLSFRNLPSFMNIFLDTAGKDKIVSLKKFGDWSNAGLDLSDNSIQLKGYVSESDSSQLINCFSGQQPVNMKLIKMLPENTAVIHYFGFSDFNLYHTKFWSNYASSVMISRKEKLLQNVAETYKLKIEDKLLEWIGNENALVILEPTGVNFENNSFGVFKANKISEAKSSLKTISRIVDKKLNTKTKEESYNGHTIGFVALNGVLPALFGETYSKVNKMYYTDIGNYIVFGNQASSIRMFIDEAKSGTLISKTTHFKTVLNQISEGGNILFYTSPSSASYILKSIFNNVWKANLDSYKEVFTGISDFSILLSANENKIAMSGLLNFSQQKRREGVSQAFMIEADSSVSMKPLLTTDPITKTRQILFQDESEELYLVSNDGDIIWKQNIDGKIIGDIFEIDLFKNNSRQFLFNTKNYLFLIDTEGKPVGNYPIRLPAVATNSVAVIDFEKRKEPRIYVACDNKRVYAYLPSGKPLPGWNFQQVTGTVTDPVRAIRLGGKDLLVISDREGGVAIVNKFGETGISLIQGFKVAKNSNFFLDPQGAAVTTDPSGNVVIISADGLVQTLPLNAAGPEHGFVYMDADGDGDPDYIFLDGKELIAYNKELALIYRKVFDSNTTGVLQLLNMKDQKQALAFCSLVSNKCWLVKPDGSIYPGFPIKGSGKMELDEMNLDGKKNLLVGDADKGMHVYSIE